MKKKYKTLRVLDYGTGFTTIELIVSILIFTTAIILVGSMHAISQKSYTKGSNEGELSQNARVSLDRISREIRQTVDILTVLPTSSTTPIDEIFFQDGHNIDIITYIYYYLDGTDLIRQHRAYYFNPESDVYVPITAVDGLGNPPNITIIEDRVVGEYFTKLEFWGADGLVNTSIGLSKGSHILESETKIYSRNL